LTGAPPHPPDPLVVDASVVAKLFLPEDLSERAEALFAAGPRPGLRVIYAPDLLYAECANIFWKHVRRDTLDETRARQHMNDVLSLGLTTRPLRDLAVSALELAAEHDITAYDACYVALALTAACDLVTADERLVNKLSTRFPFVHWLGAPEFEYEERSVCQEARRD
jgi:predicted nucleic acid-binding protein